LFFSVLKYCMLAQRFDNRVINVRRPVASEFDVMLHLAAETGEGAVRHTFQLYVPAAAVTRNTITF